MNVQHGTDSGSAVGGDRVERPVAPRDHALLRGWHFWFRDGRHHLRDIGVDRQGDNIVVFFADRNADNPFDWRVLWTHIGPQVLAPLRPTAV
jgi:hypothetical protein